jgi:hypothetical protein
MACGYFLRYEFCLMDKFSFLVAYSVPSYEQTSFT